MGSTVIYLQIKVSLSLQFLTLNILISNAYINNVFISHE